MTPDTFADAVSNILAQLYDGRASRSATRRVLLGFRWQLALEVDSWSAVAAAESGAVVRVAALEHFIHGLSRN